MDELTQKEKDFLSILLKIGRVVVEASDGYFELSSSTDYVEFSKNDLFNLAEKFGLENKY